MVVEVPPDARERLRPFFSAMPGLDGCIEAGLSGDFGRAFVDDIDAPSAALLSVDFSFLAGDAGRGAELVRSCARPATFVVADGEWERLLRDVWGSDLQSYQRVRFAPGDWKRSRLEQLAADLPDGFTLASVGTDNVKQLAELADSFVYNYPSLESFLERGAAFAIAREGRLVAGCSSFTLAGGLLEFEINTHPDFRRRGLAAACGAAMILHCVNHGLEPCWDAHNPMSARLAERLGFVDAAPYTAYQVRA